MKRTGEKIERYDITSDRIDTGYILHEEWLESMNHSYIEETTDSSSEPVCKDELDIMKSEIDALYNNICTSNEEWVRLMKNGLLPFDSDKSKIQDDEEE